MGYYVNGDGALRIKKENLVKAHEALMALQDAPDKAKSGGSYSANERRHWFSWMPEDLRTLTDTKAVFAELGFEVREEVPTGDLIISNYDNKTGQEEVFFATAAPFIEDGEYEWVGEDGTFWLWKFEDGKMFVRHGRREYGEGSEVLVADLHAEQLASAARVDAMFAKK
jgi:hypothetical protein